MSIQVKSRRRRGNFHIHRRKYHRHRREIARSHLLPTSKLEKLQSETKLKLHQISTILTRRLGGARQLTYKNRNRKRDKKQYQMLLSLLTQNKITSRVVDKNTKDARVRGSENSKLCNFIRVLQSFSVPDIRVQKALRQACQFRCNSTLNRSMSVFRRKYMHYSPGLLNPPYFLDCNREF